MVGIVWDSTIYSYCDECGVCVGVLIKTNNE